MSITDVPIVPEEASRTLRYLWLLPLASAIHEAEEWNILDWYREHWVNLGDLSQQTVWTWLVFYSLLGFAVTGISSALRRWPKVAIALVCLFFAFLFLHSFLHIYWTFYFGAYSPGVVSSIVLLIPSYVYVVRRAIREQILSIWLLIPILAINCPQLVMGFRAGNVVPEKGFPWYNLSENIASLILEG